MLVRFHDLIQMDISDWILDPFSSQVENIDVSLQESMIDLQSDHQARARFSQGFHNLWLSIEMPSNYPLLWVNAKLFLTAFPTSYLVEFGFSCVNQLLIKRRNRLDIEERGDLRLLL